MSEITSCRQFWVNEPGQGEILRRPLPARQGREVLVRTLFSAVSRGTESLVFRGEVPASQYGEMRAPFQEGSFPAPVKYGYTSVGEVIEAPDGTGADLLGRAVFCLYPHQDYYQVCASEVTPLPVDLPPERAVLAANLETAVNAVWDGEAAPGDRIVVVGAGVVGLLIAWLCRQIPGSKVLAVDVNAGRSSTASALQVPFVSEAPTDVEADVVFHASGAPAGLRSALGACGPEATLVEASWFGSESVCLPLGEAFHSKRLTIRGSQVGRIPPSRSPRWTSSRRMELALDLLRDSSLGALISGESAFEDLPEVMARLSQDPGDELCHRIRY